jgi:plastocyanin
VFEPKEFVAKANQQINLTLDNKGAAIHNFAIQGQKGPDGKDIDTGLINGGKQGSVAFTLAAGSYDFICTVHPAEMKGKLTVQ